MSFEEQRLEELCELVVDCPHSTPKWTDDGFIVLRNQNIRNGKLDLSTPSFTDEAGYNSRIKRAKPQKNDIVFTREAPMGEVCLIPEGLECCLGQRQVLLRAKPDVDPHYLFWALQSPYVQHQISWNEGTGTTVSNVRIPVLKDLKIPRLGTTEKRVGSIMTSLASKLRVNESINQTIEQMAQVLFKSWFVDVEPVTAKMAVLDNGGSQEQALLAAMAAISGKNEDTLAIFKHEHPAQYSELKMTAELFPSAMADSESGNIPQGWKAGTLNDIAIFQNGYAFKGKDWADHGFPVVKIGSVKPGLVDLTSCSYVGENTVEPLERFRLNPGDILVGMTGYVGETGLVPYSSVAPYLNQRVGRLMPVDKEQYELLYVMVRNSDYKQFVESQAQGSAQANVSGKALMSYPIVVPSGALIRKFSTLISPMLKQKLELSAQSESLTAVRDTLLPKLISGEIILPEVPTHETLNV